VVGLIEVDANDRRRPSLMSAQIFVEAATAAPSSVVRYEYAAAAAAS